MSGASRRHNPLSTALFKRFSRYLYFLIKFPGLFGAKYTSFYAFSKLKKTASKNEEQENQWGRTWAIQKQRIQILWKSSSSHTVNLFDFFFSIDGSCYCLTTFCLKNLFNGLLDKRWPNVHFGQCFPHNSQI